MFRERRFFVNFKVRINNFKKNKNYLIKRQFYIKY